MNSEYYPRLADFLAHTREKSFEFINGVSSDDVISAKRIDANIEDVSHV
jgi:hypothetical protein